MCNKKILVKRRGSAINPLHRKLAEDIWTLTDCLKHKKLVPRVILKNGKRDRETFENTQSTPPIQSPMRIPNDSIELEVTNRSSNCDCQANPSEMSVPSHATQQSQSMSMLMREVNSLWSEIVSEVMYVLHCYKSSL